MMPSVPARIVWRRRTRVIGPCNLPVGFAFPQHPVASCTVGFVDSATRPDLAIPVPHRCIRLRHCRRLQHFRPDRRRAHHQLPFRPTPNQCRRQYQADNPYYGLTLQAAAYLRGFRRQNSIIYRPGAFRPIRPTPAESRSDIWD